MQNKGAYQMPILLVYMVFSFIAGYVVHSVFTIEHRASYELVTEKYEAMQEQASFIAKHRDQLINELTECQQAVGFNFIRAHQNPIQALEESDRADRQRLSQ